jgi:thiamine transport system ATP-binding protein
MRIAPVTVPTQDGGSGPTLHGVGVRYGDVVAVAGASLTVDAGEVVAVTGPSGGGKSSLLSAIAGIVAYTGRIAWNDEDLSSVPVHRRGVGLVFQDGQ